MKKLFLWTFVLTLLCTWAVVGADQASNVPTASDQARMEILRSLTAAVRPEATGQYIPGARRFLDVPITSPPRQRSIILTDWLFDDFEDGDFTNNPTWTAVSNGDGNGTEDWTVYADPWIYTHGTAENHGSGFLIGSDSDGGGALADEELTIDFSTPVGGQLTLEYWLYFRAYNPPLEYFEVLIDDVQIDLVMAPDDIAIVGVRSIIIDEYADGSTHTLTMHYYADYGYVCAIDDVVISDDPCEVTCPVNGIPESEPECYDGYEDEYNVGCDAEPPVDPIWTEISCGDTICGKSGVFPVGEITNRDADWYTFDLAVPAVVEMGAVGEFPLQLLFFDRTVSCDDYNYTGYSAGRCDTVRITETLLPGEYWLWAGPTDWYEDMACDGTGDLGINYVMWLVCTPTPPCNPEMVIGDINPQLPYSDIGQTTCGAVNNWDETCLDDYDGGEDFVYEFTVSELITVDITLDPHATGYTGILIDDFCPPNPDDCIAISTSDANSPHGFEGLPLLPGPYWIMVDTNPSTACIGDFNLTIEEALGACCIDYVCEFTSEEQVCLDAGGNWYEGEECPDFACPMVWTPVNEDGFGNPNNISIDLLPLIFENCIYAGTSNSVTGGEVWRSSDGSFWTQVNTDGFGDPYNWGVGLSWIFEGELYASTFNAVTGTEIWKSSDGENWTQENIDGFGDPNNYLSFPTGVYQDELYAGTFNPITGGQLWKASYGTPWDPVTLDGFGDSNNNWITPSVVFSGKLYATVGNHVAGTAIVNTSDGINWDPVVANGFGDPNNHLAFPIVIFEDILYTGTSNSVTGGEVWRSYNGSDWSQVNSDGFGNPHNDLVFASVVFNDNLFAGTSDTVSGGEIWRTDNGIRWIKSNFNGFGDPNNEVMYANVVFENHLYVGTQNTATGGQLWVSETYTLPTGACCDEGVTGDCQDGLTAVECEGLEYARWEQDILCDDLEPPCEGAPPACVYIVGDCNHNGVALELADVIAMIAYYRGQQTPQYSCDCPPHGDNFAPDADPNSNCTAFELADAVAEIAFYRGLQTPGAGCADCPAPGGLGPGGEGGTTVIPSLKSKVKINKGNMEE